jgi:hypothetical protein
MAPETTLVDPRRIGPPFAVGVLAVLGTLPVVTTLEPLAGVPRWVVVVAVIGTGVVAVGVAAAIGAMLAGDVGLRAFAPDRFSGDGVGTYRLPAVAGVGVALATVGVHALVAAVGGDPAPPNRWTGDGSLGMVASVAGGVLTELVLRFGFMTLVVWTAWTYRPAVDLGVTRTSAWAGIVAAAALGGCAAAPAAAVGGFDPVTVGVAALVTFGGGVVFGYLYWRYDLAAAAIAHGVAGLLRALVASV